MLGPLVIIIMINLMTITRIELIPCFPQRKYNLLTSNIPRMNFDTKRIKLLQNMNVFNLSVKYLWPLKL